MQSGRPCRGQNPTYRIEPLEPRWHLAANLHVVSVSLVDQNLNPVSSPTIGYYVYAQVVFETTDLPADAQYTISQTMYGTTYTNTINWNAGVVGTYTQTHIYGYWQVNHSGPGNLTISVDSTNTVAESDENDNSGSAPFTPVQLPLPSTFTQPLGGVGFRDYGFVNYTDPITAPSAFADYRGGPYTYDGHSGIDMTFPSFRDMDEGTPIFAAAAGTVLYVDDGWDDRNTTSFNNPNFVTIDYGNGWIGEYVHMRNGSVGVQAGQTVVQGQMIGLIGSSGYSTGPHLHFSTLNADAIETYADPYAYWQNPLPYQGDVEQVVDAGITNYNPNSILNSEERPPEHRTFKNISGQTAYSWFQSFNSANEPASITYYRPNGTTFSNVNFMTGGYANRGGYYSFGQALPSSPDIGTWQAAFVVNGVELRRESFTVNATGSAGARVNNGSLFVADSRTTPIDGGTYALNAVAPALSFTLTNFGTATMTTSALTAPTGWTIVDSLAASLAPGASDTFSFKPNTATAGYRYGFASFSTNDPLIPTYDFALAATVNPAAAVPAVSVFSRDLIAGETDLDPGVVRVVRTGDTSSSLVVNLSVAGSAVSGSDYQPIASSVTLQPGQAAASVIVTPINDPTAEADDTVIISLAGSVNYTAAPNSSATITIKDNDGTGSASISGKVYFDKNFNTYADAGETGISGIQLFLDANADNIRQAGEPMTTTTGSGAYTFSNLVAGRYHIRQMSGSAFIITTPLGSYSVATGQALTGVDLGAFQIVFTGSSGSDVFSVAPTGTPNRVLITAGGNTYNALQSQLPSLSFYGNNGDDTLTLDASTLSPVTGVLSAPSIVFDGGDATDTLTLVNTQATDDLAVQSNQLELAATTVALNASEKTVLDAPIDAIIPLRDVTISSGALSLVSGKNVVMSVASLVISGTGTLDLTDNSLIVDYVSINPAADIEADVAAGYNGGDWLGNGITSSAAASDPNFHLGVADNANLPQPFGTAQGGPLFDGVDVDDTCVLVKFTHRTDLNLDGLVTDTDAITFSTNFEANAAAYWSIGDLDMDGLFTDNDAILFSTYYDPNLPQV